MKLHHQVIISVGELALLTCEVSGDPEPSVTWTKNGNSTIPRAQFKNDGHILIIEDVPHREVVLLKVKHPTSLEKAEHLTSLFIDLICISTAGWIIDNLNCGYIYHIKIWEF